MRRPSLQRRLLWSVGLPVVALWLGAALWLALGARHETAEMFDRELERTAAGVLAVLAATPDVAFAESEVRPPSCDAVAARHGGEGHRPDDERNAGEDRHDDAPRPEIVVRDRRGHVLLDASSLPPLPADSDAAHFHTLQHAGETWRVHQRWDRGRRHWIQVAAPLHDREELLWALAQGTVLPLLTLLALLPAATWLGLRSGLAPLRAVSRALAGHPASTPMLTGDAVPGELLQLTRAVDALVAGLAAALARERRFTADAAHELRHPLSVLQLELELASRATSAEARARHLQRAREGLDRMQRLVAQLLTLARVESLDAVPDAASLALAEVVRAAVAEANERALPRGVVLSLEAGVGAQVHGSAGLLSIALHNLLENAISHGRAPGHVDVTLRDSPDGVDVVVDDDGPGIPAGQAARLGERFLRSRGTGSGLGLSIVQAIAALHGGTLAVGRSPLGGARMVLQLPGAPRSDPPSHDETTTPPSESE